MSKKKKMTMPDQAEAFEAFARRCEVFYFKTMQELAWWQGYTEGFAELTPKGSMHEALERAVGHLAKAAVTAIEAMDAVHLARRLATGEEKP